jgi:uncharacterized protein YqhQ
MKQERLPSYGGQALMEGVLMRGSKTAAAAVRKPDGTLEIIREELSGIYLSRIRKIPFLRGLLGLWDALGLGMHFLTISANLQTDNEDEKLEGPALYLTLGLSLVISIALFFLLPALAGQLTEKYLHWNAWTSNLAEGLIRLAIIVLYMWVIGWQKDIQRVFAYHGAEHKTINAFEDKAELTPACVSKYSLEHPRCGTGFLLTVAVISILVFTLLGPLSTFMRLATRVIFLPVIVGISYEYMRWTANNLDKWWVRIFVKPNLLLQKLTTREPDPGMLEVAISAFNAMYESEQETVKKEESTLTQPVPALDIETA